MCRRRRPARRRGRGPRSLFSWRRHRLFFPNRKPDGGAWPTPPRPPEALPARLRGGQRGPAVPAAPFPAAGPAPPPPPPGGWKGRRAGGWRGQERAFPRRDSACRAAAGPDGLGAQGGRAHLSRRGPPLTPLPRPRAARRRPGPRPAPPTPAPNGPEPRAHRGRPRGPSSSASLALRQPAGTPARLRSPSGAGAEPPGTFIQRGPRDQSDGGHRAPR